MEQCERAVALLEGFGKKKKKATMMPPDDSEDNNDTTSCIPCPCPSPWPSICWNDCAKSQRPWTTMTKAPACCTGSGNRGTTRRCSTTGRKLLRGKLRKQQQPRKPLEQRDDDDDDAVLPTPLELKARLERLARIRSSTAASVPVFAYNIVALNMILHVHVVAASYERSGTRSGGRAAGSVGTGI